MKNVVLICIDTVRKDFFDENAHRTADLASIDVNECRATSAWSTPSHASLLTGKLPHQHGIHTYQRTFEGLAEDATFFNEIPEHTSVGISANAFASPSYGFDSFFSEFKFMASPYQRFLSGLDPSEYSQEDQLAVTQLWNFLNQSFNSECPASSLLNGVLGLMKDINRRTPLPNLLDDGAKPIINEATNLVENIQEPYFLFINLMDAHLPLEPHRYMHDHSVPGSWSTYEYEQWDYVGKREEFEDYWGHREDLYGSMIDYLDRKISAFIHTVREISTEPVSFVITADHGENHGLPEEDGLVNHTSSLSEGLLHVPLCIVDDDGIVPSPGDRLVSHLDVPDLISALANEGSFGWNATPRAEVMGMGPNPEPPSHKEFWDRTIRCVYDDRKKFVWDTQDNESVYEVEHGRPSWQRELDEEFDVHSGLESFFERDIHAAREEANRNQQSVSISESTENRLEELGYL